MPKISRSVSSVELQKTAPLAPKKSPTPKSSQKLEHKPSPIQKMQSAPNLLSPQVQKNIQEKSSSQIQEKSKEVPTPSSLKARLMRQLESPLNDMDNDLLVQTLMKGQDESGGRYSSVYRGKQELQKSGILGDLSILAARNIEVPKSEYDRSINDDAILVMTDLSKLTETQIDDLKNKVYTHPETIRDLPVSIDKGYYGSDQHRQYGALVEKLTGGIISSEEAMRMNPAGGLPGPGSSEVPVLNRFDFMQRHALRHDAKGFLINHFGVGPGYGSKTTMVGLDKHNPLAGQVLGIAKEAFGDSSDIPDPQYRNIV